MGRQKEGEEKEEWEEAEVRQKWVVREEMREGNQEMIEEAKSEGREGREERRVGEGGQEVKRLW